ncbi:helix-turn-helix domain-containing protein [Ciceribacter sp. L1K23]|uniref:helix-turn-helix domain-containing protein n=1 Tax=Ciceribacter sp. L1K23 TaxID=2820276 RepID=UPI001B82B508|nr:helix-turn-helix domain-containing protein [Ciceribacter sp. L1K23]MBR0556576.1 helix-turn-helix domain-containing protein [Ciceribacter sp. L1K23]
MTIKTPIPAIHVDTQDFPAAEQFATWSRGVTTHKITRPVAATEPFMAVVDAWMLGDMVLTHSRLDPTKFSRTTEMIRADGLDWVQVVLINAGTLTFQTDDQGEPRQMWQGEVAAFDARRPLTTESSVIECVTCTVARRAFTAVNHEPFHHHGRVIDGPWGRLLADCLLSLVRQVGEMQAADAANLTTAFVNLLVTALRAKERDAPVPPQKPSVPLRQRVEAYIDQNLTAADLTPKKIASDLAVSQSNLYRAFANTGGVTAYIRRRRLETIHSRLNGGDAISVGEVARAYGFVSAAHFSRAFRRQFGFAPRRTRAMDMPAGPLIDTENANLFRAWEERLS